MTETQPLFDIPTTIARAETLLSRHFGAEIHLRHDQQFDSPHLVLRCLLEKPIDDQPKTIILKQLSVVEEGDDAQVKLFLNEWASLQFLSEIAPNESLAPRLYIGDHEARLMILEDLGDYPSVQDILFSDDTQHAQSALTRYGSYLANLHQATIGHESRFCEIQASLGAQTPLSDSSNDLRTHLENLQAGLHVLKITSPAELEAEINTLESTLHSDTHPFRVLIHADAGAHNIMDRGESIILYDFAFATYSHALLDLVSARLGFPHAFKGMSSPMSIVETLESAYQETLSEHITEAGDDTSFQRELTYAVAHWTLGRTINVLGYLMAREQHGEAVDEQRGHMSEEVAQLLGQETTLTMAWFKRGILTCMDSLLAMPTAQTHLPAIYQVIQAIRTDLDKRWADINPLPLYPAFREA